MSRGDLERLSKDELIELVLKLQRPVQDRQVLPAGLLAERTGQPAFAHAARPGDHQVAPAADPVAAGQL
jgi:hypothetical protein